MSTWSSLSHGDKMKALQAIGTVFKNEPACAEGTITANGENVFILPAQQKDINSSLEIKVTIPPSQSGQKDELTRKIKEAAAGVADAKIEVGCSYNIGDTVTTIDNVTKVEGKQDMTFTHNKGEVILLDFWATWCPPCQAPMAHNQKMLTDNAGKWGRNVRIVGFSIDNDADTVKRHVDAKGWGAVEHYHVRNGKCTADKDYGVRGVPHCLLLDKEGKIVFIGHPATRKLEEDIDTLLAGGTISGAGTTKGGEDEDEGEGEEAGDISGADADAATEEFLKEAETIMNSDACKEASSGAPRAFLVLVSKGKYDWKTDQLKYGLQHYQVFVAQQAKIDALKAASAPLRTGRKWKVIERSQAM